MEEAIVSKQRVQMIEHEDSRGSKSSLRDVDALSCMSGATAVSAVSAVSTKSKKHHRGSKRRKAGDRSMRHARPTKPPFTQELLVTSLSQLGKTADGVNTAYLRVDISGTDLASTAPITATYTDLQTLNLPDNDLRDLSSLQQLRHLTSLDVSGNALTKVLGFSAPAGGSNLRVADMANNHIQLATDITHHSRLQHLRLDQNQMETCTGLGHLPVLSSLSLSNNQLRSLIGVEQLLGLRQLCVQDNHLRSLAPISGLKQLEVLQAARNQITSLEALSSLVRLQKLDVSSNQLFSLSDIVPCREASLLAELHVSDNPLCGVMSCRLHLVHLLPQVSVLNDVEVTAQEKVHAANMHGADAEGLRRIRQKHFPAGELDDGGGALPPPSAGLVASAAEEEQSDSDAVAASLIRIDAWARSIPVPQPLSGDAAAQKLADTAEAQGGLAGTGVPTSAALLALGTQLAGACDGQLQVARVCLEWLVSHVARPPAPHGPASVDAPLFDAASGGQASEELLLQGQEGTWAERVACLYTLLAKACELEAVVIPGYCKRLGLMPGESLAVHNHCWAGVKVGGRWRLLDPAMCTLTSACSDSPAAPFFVPPSAWIYAYLPLEAHWQLLPEPISLSAWQGLPHCSVGFFARGMQLVSPTGLSAVNHLPAPREGGALPCMKLCVAAPVSHTSRLCHVLRDAKSGQEVARCPASPLHPCTQPPALAYQQLGYGEQSLHRVQFGAQIYRSQQHHFYTSLPAPGEYLLELHHISDLPGGMQVQLEGQAAPLQLHVYDDDLVLTVKVVVPQVEPHEPEDGLLHDPSLLVTRSLPITHEPLFNQLQPQVLSPEPGALLEADRPYTVRLMAPDGLKLAVVCESGHLTDLTTGPLCSSRPPSQPTASSRPVSRQAGSSKPASQQACNTPPDTVQTSANNSRPASRQAGRSKPVSQQACNTPPDTVQTSANNSRPASRQAGSMTPDAPQPSCNSRPTSRQAGDLAPADRQASHSRLLGTAERDMRPGSRAHVSKEQVSRQAGDVARPASATTPQMVLYQGHVTAPRAPNMQIVVVHEPGNWQPVLSLQILPETQHIIDIDCEEDIPQFDITDPHAQQAKELFTIMDKNMDGLVTRAELVAAVRHSKQVADTLKLPHFIRACDDSLDRLVDQFEHIDVNRHGHFTFSELCLHMGIKPSEQLSSDDYTGSEDGSEEGTYFDEEGESRPVSPTWA